MRIRPDGFFVLAKEDRLLLEHGLIVEHARSALTRNMNESTGYAVLSEPFGERQLILEIDAIQGIGASSSEARRAVLDLDRRSIFWISTNSLTDLTIQMR